MGISREIKNKKKKWFFDREKLNDFKNFSWKKIWSK